MPDGTTIEPVIDFRLRECSLGVFEGLHKDEIFGPRFAPLFRRLASLPHEARLRTSYFEGLESPLQISSRALEAARALAVQVPRGGTVACITHSVILESLLAAAFSKDFEAVHTNTLAWLRCTFTHSGGFKLEATDGIECVPSPDALALDLGAVGIAPPPSLGLPVPVPPSLLGLAAGDARAAAVLRRGGATLTLAALTTLGSTLYAGRLGFGLSVTSPSLRSLTLSAWRYLLSALRLSAALHSTYCISTVVLARTLVQTGLRASLRAAPPWLPLGLWMPRVVLAPCSVIAATK